MDFIYKFHNFFYFSGIGISNSLRTIVGQEVGSKNMEKAKTVFLRFVSYTFCLFFILSVALFLFAKQVALIYFKKEQELGLLTFLFRLYALMLPIYKFQYSMLTALRILDKDKIILIFSAIGVPLIQVGLVLFCFYVLKISLIGFLISYFGTLTFLALFYFCLLYRLDWKTVKIKEMKESDILENERSKS